MPRIELITEDFNESTGDGTPTVDVCREHADCFVEGETWEWQGNDNQDYVIGSTDVDHPPYEDDECLCAVCGEQLTNED